MRAVDIIANKKNGKAHSREELQFWINGIVNNEIPDYQIAAWLMAVRLNGMNFDETAYLTELIANTGTVLDLSSISEFILDKHSTGGVGDKITLILIPLMAACGGKVAKLSGRGLGHTGGTIDKLESIYGFNTNLPIDDFIAQVKNNGCAIASQTSDLAYADKKFYELRDVTSTVDCLPLIASSVVSKKIASGANVIVLDVKYGDGAIVKTTTEAEKLSEMMVEIAKRLNRSITAVISSMEEPLGHNIGNALEVIESIEVLKGNGPKDLIDLTFELGSILLLNSKLATTKENAIKLMQEQIANGNALNKLKELIELQGGDVSCVYDYTKFPKAKIVESIYSTKSGYLNKIKALDVAVACKMLGAGRDKKTDNIDFSAGVVLNKKVGEKIEIGEKLVEIHTNSDTKLNEVREILINAFVIEDITAPTIPLIHKVIC